MDLNKVMIIGRLTQDPESRSTPQGVSVCTFSVATNLTWKDANGQLQKKVEYHNVVAWRKLAEICGQYLKKGKQVYLEGRLQTRSWADPQGVKKYRTEIVADNMIMLGDRDSGAPRGAGPAASPAAANDAVPVIEVPKEEPEGEDTIKVEDIPF